MGVFIRFGDGREYAAADWDGVLTLIRTDTIFDPPSTNAAYKAGVQLRVGQFSGDWLDVASAEKFLRDMHRIGLITEIKET